MTKTEHAADDVGEQVEDLPLKTYLWLVENAPFGVYCRNSKGRLLMANRAFRKMLGYADTHQFLAQNFFQDICAETEGTVPLKYGGAKGGNFQGEVKLRRQDGAQCTALVTESRGLTADLVEGFVENVSARLEAEKTLQVAHRMEAIGHLANGVAHDFNNILNLIAISAELLGAGKLAPDEVRFHAEAILQGVRRSGSLTQQLLALGQHRPSHPETVRVEELLRPFASASWLLGRDVECRILEPTAEVGITIDRAHWEHLILNLLINARDSMPQGGLITIGTKRIPAESEALRAQRRCYLDLTISDTGAGMDENTLLRIFDPYFTTKPKGKGTGLGLTLVQKVVVESNGSISVSSTQSKGTKVRVLLPALDLAEGPKPMETILLLADGRRKSADAAERLRSIGFMVRHVGDLGEAKRIAKRRYRKPALLLINSNRLKKSAPSIIKYFEQLTPKMGVLFWSEHHSDLAAVGKNPAVFDRLSAAESIGKRIQTALSGN